MLAQTPVTQRSTGRGFQARMESAGQERHVPPQRIKNEVVDRASAHVRELRTDNLRAHLRANVADAVSVIRGNVAEKVHATVAQDVRQEVTHRVRERLVQDIESNVKEQLKLMLEERMG